jgi:serine/threonine protein kinase
MGEVWRAEDTKLLRQVAIKILPAQLAADHEWKERFLREARTVAQLNHPNIATIYSIDQQGDSLFIAMELIEGEPLSALIARGPIAAAEAVKIGSAIADGLSEAHAKAIVHRDIKPDNILLSPRFVKILDFGIAKHIGGTADPGLTQGGLVVGTPHYMSPEQALGRTIDARTDIFSFGVMLYEMLTGRRPFSGEAITEVLLQIVMNEPLDIEVAAPGVPVELATIVRRCMQKKAEDRYRDCDELHEALLAAMPAGGNGARRTLNEPLPAENVQWPSAASQAPTPRDASPVMRPATPLPSAMPPAKSSAPQPPRQAPQPAKARFRALVADDDPATRYLVGSVLSRNGVAYDEVSNGAEAVRYLKSNEYAVVFIDLLMPRIDGWGVIDFLRSRRMQHPPRVFIITGVHDQKLSVADQDIVSGLLYKPIDVAQVERLVAV